MRIVNPLRARSRGVDGGRIGAGVGLVTLLAASLLAIPASASAENTAAVAWGHNSHGQLGSGYLTSGSEERPVTVVGLKNVAAMAGGWEDSFAMLANGTVRSWGSNLDGQLGDGTAALKGSPSVVKNEESTELTGVKEIATNGDHSMVLLENGSVATWGDSQDGTRGNGESGVASEALEMHEKYGTPYQNRELAAELKLESNVKQIAIAGATNMALLENGKVMTWGGNGNGKLGIGVEPGGKKEEPFEPETCKLSSSSEKKELEPEDGDVACSKYPVEVKFPAGVEVVGIGGGYGTAYAVLSNGGVMAWGNGADGALGNGAAESSDAPVYVNMENVPSCPEYSAATHCPVVEVSGGKQIAWALTAGGEIIGWGWNGTGQLGSASTEECKKEANTCSMKPKVVIGSGFGKVSAMSVGYEAGGVFTVGSTMYTIGSNEWGLLGVGGLEEAKFTRTPVAIEGLAPVAGVAAGEQSNLAFLKEGAGPPPLLKVTPKSKALTFTWTAKAAEVKLKLKVVAEKGVEVKGAESKTIAVVSTGCSASSPCSETISEVKGSSSLSSEDEYELRFQSEEATRKINGVPLP
jgi:alpha-tubulin suppressor-like RCC1 family protein